MRRTTIIFLTLCAAIDATPHTNDQKVPLEVGGPVRFDVPDDVTIRLPSYVTAQYHIPEHFKKSAKILFWTPSYGDLLNWSWWFNPIYMNETCPNIDCQFTIDKSQVNSSDVIVFMIYEENVNLSAPQLPTYRRADQRWVYFTLEPPSLNQLDLSSLNHLFNWTMTYRRDSDVVAHYGKVIFRTLSTPEAREASWKRNYALGKSKLVAWYVGHCQTEGKREVFIEEMKKYIEVDVYGLCGPFKCDPPRSQYCDNKLGQEYKFYLSFENVLCKDYVTEKFIRALAYDVVPVVFGGADYTRFAPLGSYINALDFPSPRQLAEYLLFLHKNDREYNRFFDWKRGYGPGLVRKHETWACELCAKAMDPDTTPKVYHDLNDWWNVQSNCTAWQPPN